MTRRKSPCENNLCLSYGGTNASLTSVNHSSTQTFFDSVKNRNASQPPSFPTPLFFIPPNGVRRSRSNQQLTQMIPLSTLAATRLALEISCVHIVAASP